MGKKSSPPAPPAPPAPPPPKEMAAAQTATNIGTAIAQQALSNVNQVTPDGSLTFAQTGSHTYTDPGTGKRHVIPTYTATQTLSPEQQKIHDQTNQAQINFSKLASDQSARLNGLLDRPVDTDTLPDRGDLNTVSAPTFAGPGDAGQITQTYNTDFSEDRQRVEDALMGRMQGRLDRDKQALESRLASQGIRMGSEAYQAAMEDHGRQVNDARMGAILAGGQEQSRLTGLEAARAGFENTAQSQAFSQDMAKTQFNNANQTARFNADLTRVNAHDQRRNQVLQEQLALRNQPINEITALMSGSQVTQPNFINPQTAQLATTDFAGIQAGYNNAMHNRHAAQLQAHNAAANRSSNLFGGMLGLGANLLMASDRRVKTDVKKVGTTNDGQNIYRFRYKSGGPIQMGLMAQEVQKKKPEAVAEVEGVKMVDYGKALSTCVRHP